MFRENAYTIWLRLVFSERVCFGVGVYLDALDALDGWSYAYAWTPALLQHISGGW